MGKVNWDESAQLGGLRSVIDPKDTTDFKNRLIDTLHWDAMSKSLEGNGSILDYGCGIGRFAQRLVDRGLRYYGVDTSIGMIEAAKQFNVLNRAEFIYASSLPLPFAVGQFDFCLSVWVLQYLMQSRCDKGVDVFSELARVLPRGGKLLIIEQASASGRSSGSVESCSTEADYIKALSEFFMVERVERIRCGRMTKLSSIYLQYGKFLPLKNVAINILAKHEARHALNAGTDLLKSMDYYDIFIKAVKK